MARRTVDAYIKAYKPREGATPSERVAEFLNKLAIDYPLDFVSRRTVAKIAFNLKNTPQDTNEVMRRLSNVIMRADEILGQTQKRRIVFDRVEGYRATYDDQDLASTKFRQQTNRLRSAHKAVAKTADMIDARNLSGPLRDEVLKSREALKRIGSNLLNIPMNQLPPKPAADR